MRRIRSLAAQAPAIAISVLAVALSLGGGAYASTHLAAGQHAASSTTTSLVSWSTLGLKNGWQSENSVYGTGNPKVSSQNGIVYLSGSLAQPTPGSAIFATLPKGDRPTHNMYITVYTNGDTTGTLYIGADGTLEAYSSGTCGSGTTAECFTSLATVSYPVNS